MDGELARSLGERVRLARQRNYQTQEVVAGLSGITTDYLYQIERGKKLPALPVLMDLARVLRVPASTLLGETQQPARVPPLEAGAALCRALTDPIVGDTVPPVADLRNQIRAAWATWQGCPERYSQVGVRLPRLVVDAEQSIRAVPASDQEARRQANQCAADLYGLVRTVAKRMGRTDLALLAADRGVRAAEEADDLVRWAGAQWNLAHVLLAQGELEGAEAVALHAAEALGPLGKMDLDAVALVGALRLLAAMASVRLGNQWTARERVQSVRPLAQRAGERNVCWTAFGPTNVAMYAVSVEVEAGNTREALRLAEQIEPGPELSIERRVAFHLERATGHSRCRNFGEALSALHAVSVEAPEDIRYRPAARTALHEVVRRARGTVARQAARLATQVEVVIG